MRYLALGDSYTVGEGVGADERWPALLADALRDGGVAIEAPRVIATTGWTTAVTTKRPAPPLPEWADDERPAQPGELHRIPAEIYPGTPGASVAWQLGRAVLAWREAHGLTQRQLAARLGWSQPALARLEGGGVAPTLTTLATLVATLGARVTVLRPAAKDVDRRRVISGALCAPCFRQILIRHPRNPTVRTILRTAAAVSRR